jgi:D-alanyl-D-alanine carboxypeptidase/D-alanyl-D-alanine-endopeptidase (penicillin-binding protein 4)
MPTMSWPFLRAIAVLLAWNTAALAQNALPDAVVQALRAANVPATAVGIAVQDVTAVRPSVALNEQTPLNPASVMKLVTTYAGLEILGPAYRWKTEAYVNGTLNDGVLQGDLVLKGYGDPKLVLEDFWLLLKNIRERGVREVRGDLVLDRSYFGEFDHDPARFDAEPFRPYNVGPDALLVNFKSVRFHFAPQPDRSSVRVLAEPRPHPLEVVNVLKLANGACGDWRRELRPDFQPAAAGRTAFNAIFTGTYAASCGEKVWNVSLFSHTNYVAGLFRQLWEEAGGTWSGSVRSEKLPREAKLLYSHESRPLTEVVRDVNKFSNNVMARQLYLTIAAESTRQPARTDAALKAVQGWLVQKGLDIPELVIENGSGLSRIERISAQSLALLLVAAFRSPAMPEFMASMPLVAVDGTMRRRLKGEGIAGQAHIKTGSLYDVRAIGGYVLDRAGRRQAVVMIINHANAGSAMPAIEALLKWVHDRP